MSNILSYITAALAAFVLVGCSNSSRPPATTDSSAEIPAEAVPSQPIGQEAPERQVYQVRGIVQSFEDETSVVIKHEEIPGYMQAMTMPFDVKAPEDLQGISPGDVVRFDMVITPENGWIENLEKIGQTNAPSLNVRPSTRLVREVEQITIGDQLPNYRFTNELGKAVELKDFLGQPLALTFIFTRCPFPEYCPRMSRQFAEAAKKLSTGTNALPNWQLLSLTIDPEYDTPQRLERYAKSYRYDPKRWSFLTGAMIDIDAITEQFGVAFAWRTGSIAHTLATVVIDPNGRIQKIFPARQWTTDDLVQEMRKAAEVPKAPAAATNSDASN